MSLQEKLQQSSDQYQDLQTELSSLVTARQRLEGQQQENRSVQKEFKSLGEDASVYKLVGPVLLKQELSEARSTVDGRLDFIVKEIARIENNIKEVQQRSESTRMDIMKLQNEAQQATGQTPAP